jgi:hypothetical protein
MEKLFELEDDINAAITASLNHLRKDNYRAAIDSLPNRWEKCMDSAGDYNQWTTCMQTMRNISSVILYFVITIKSYM